MGNLSYYARIVLVFVLLCCIGVLFPNDSTAQKRGLLLEDVAFVNPLQHGAACNRTTLNAAITAIGSDDRVLMIPPVDRANAACSWTIDSNFTIPANVVLYVPNGSLISINGSITLTMHTCPLAGTYQIFTGAGANGVDLVRCGYALADWFGITRNDATADNGPAINNAILSLNPTNVEGDSGVGGVVYFSGGEQWTDTQINLKNSVNLQGSSTLGTAIRCDGNTLTTPCVDYNGDTEDAFNEANITIRDMQIMGLDTPSAGGTIFHIDDGSNIHLYNVNIRSSNTTCVHVEGSSASINFHGGRTEACRNYNYDVSGTSINFYNIDAGATNDFAVGTGTLLRYEGGIGIITGSKFEGSSRAGVCVEFNGASRLLFAGNRVETCTANSITVTASTTNENITIVSNTIGPAGAAARIDFQVTTNTCQNLQIQNNRFPQNTGTTIFDGSACCNFDYFGNDTEIASPTHVLGYAGTIEHVRQYGCATSSEQGVLNDAIWIPKRAIETACATSLDASSGNFWEIETCASGTTLDNIVNGYPFQIVLLTCTAGNSNYTVPDTGSINLNPTGGTFTCQDDAILVLATLDGSNWIEVTRSAN